MSSMTTAEEYSQLRIESDVALYVTNRGEGFVGVSREDFVWRCEDSVSSRIDILPGDVNLPYDRDDYNNHTRIFTIGVFGYTVGLEYELVVMVNDPVPIYAIQMIDTTEFHPAEESKRSNSLHSKSGCHVSHSNIVSGAYSYHSISLAEAKANGDEIVVVISCASNIVSMSSVELIKLLNKEETWLEQRQVNMTCGRGVYTADTFPIFGSNIEHTTQRCASETGAPFPIVYISQSCKYPSADNYSWRASGCDGSAVFVIDPTEMNDSMHLGLCYFSIFCYDTSRLPYTPPCNIDESVRLLQRKTSLSEPGSTPHTCVLSLFSRNKLQLYSNEEITRFNLFSEAFSNINGNLLSQKDRESSKLMLENEYMYTYGEIEYTSFQDILQQAGAVDGQIFYDLGAGCGKAVFAAALASKVRFLKCVGIELLPTLCYCASSVVAAVTATPIGHHTVQPPGGIAGAGNAFLKSFNNAVLKSLQKSFNADHNAQLNESTLESMYRPNDPLPRQDTALFQDESKVNPQNENNMMLPMGVNVSSIHSDQSVASMSTAGGGGLHPQFKANRNHLEYPPLNPATAQYFNHNLNQTQQEMKLSGKIVADAVQAASSLFSIPKDMAAKIQVAKLRLPITEIRFGDIVDEDMDWSDGDFIFMSGYTYPDDLLSSVMEKARSLKPGSKFVTLTLPEDEEKLFEDFELVKSFMAKMSWGRVTVFVLVRRHNPMMYYLHGENIAMPSSDYFVE